MKYSNQIPAIYKRCHEVFGVQWSKGIIITYGDTVYCKNTLPPHKIVHEEVHVKQQTEMDKDEWWDRYFSDVGFRAKQEIEAYQAEAKFIKKTVKDRNMRYDLTRKIWEDLSSSIYGNILTMREAMAYIPTP